MEQEHEKIKFKLGLLGRNISYSFSRNYFRKKFENEGIAHITYENFDIDTIDLFPKLIKRTPKLKGLNVTIPYKEVVIPFLDELNKEASEIGAVNTIKVHKSGKLIGYNTDYHGFEKSIKPLLNSKHTSALILGTGGASKAVVYALKNLGINCYYVSRRRSPKVSFTYDDLNQTIIKDHLLIVNCTPLGTFPNITDSPEIPYEAITKDHLLYDLIYNPAETQFLKNGKVRGATICNGQNMLELQAEKAWSIWNLS